MARTPSRSALVMGWTMIHVAVIFLAWQVQAENVTAATPSGCQICATTGDCSRAYRGEPGQFCGNWLDRSSTRQSCCCPENAVCKVANYACNCAWRNRHDGYDAGGAGYTLAWLWWLLGSLLLLCCCGSFLFMLFRSRNGAGDGQVPVAYPAPDPPTYGVSGSTPTAPVYTAQPAYAQSYGAAPVYGQPAYGSNYRGGMSAGTGAALGGGAGLLGGLLLGEALADAGHQGGFDGGGYDGGGGGYDGGGGGDFGGDF